MAMLAVISTLYLGVVRCKLRLKSR